MADKLTPQQAMVVRDRGGKLLVSAAAGSGKTKVLVDRLLGYLTDPVDPANLDDFLIITYTKAAASELRGKIAEKLTERIARQPEDAHLQKQMQRLFLTKISTVHGFCADILREYAYKLDISADFRVADENEAQELRERVLAELLDEAYRSAGEDPYFRAFIDTQGLGRDDRLVPEIIGKVYDSAMCHLDPEGWLDSCLNAVDIDGICDAGETIWGRYMTDDLFCYLDKQLLVMNRCAQEAAEAPGLEKAAANLNDTLNQLQALRASTTWDEIVANRSIDYGRLTFPRKNSDPDLTERIKAVRGACKTGLGKKLQAFSNASGQVLSDLQQSAAGTKGLVSLVRSFAERYRSVKRSRRVLDFSDLEHRTLDLLLGKSRSSPTAAASEIGSRFREIMVDEYQDSNGVQDAIFDSLTRDRQNCFLVGDVKQSIYQFRLADPGIFLDKYGKYVPAEEAVPGQGRKVLLSHNFRSGAEVIEAVNDVFRSCMSPQVGGLYYTDAEALREGVPRGILDGPGVELYALDIREDTYSEEAAFVADKIVQMLTKKVPVRKDGGFAPVKPEDIVILLRSPGSVGSHFQQALEARGLRCNTGGGTDLLQTEEIATFRALLQTVVNPRQDIPLVSVLASPLFCFTADDLASFRGRQKKGNIYDALLGWNSPKAALFLEILEVLRYEAGIKPLTQLLERCMSLTRMDSIYAAMPGGEARKANLQLFYKLASDFEMGNTRDLSQFLEHLDALEGRGLINSAGAVGGAVTIMSIHKSKGLEFPVVFLCGLSREFNRESLRAPVLCDQELGLGLSVVDSHSRIRYPSISKRAITIRMASESVSEEMRVLYVAMTRARDRLIMTYAPRNLEGDLKSIVLRKGFDNGELLCMEASCPGDWVMTTALGRTEAGALFALAGKPDETQVSRIPWKIEVTQAPEKASESIQDSCTVKQTPAGAVAYLRKSLDFHYPHSAATQAPSKQTATGIKGREKDEEAAENTRLKKHLSQWRTPSFRGNAAGGTVYGNIIHSAMQYLQFDRCGSEESIRKELSEIVGRGLLTGEALEMIDVSSLARFFDSPIGRKLQSGAPCLREFKFSILDNGSRYGDGLEGEQVLLQGVVDCAILEEDGIIVIDFKTDRVMEDTLSTLAEHYRPQVIAYSDALSRIYEMPVKESYLYFFRLNRFVKM